MPTGRGVPVRALRWSAVLVPGVVALALGSWGIGRDSLFGSEADTYWVARLPIGQLTGLLGNLDAVHGTYYLFMKAWLSLGTSFAWLRVPSVAGMVIAAVLVSVLGTRLTGRAVIGLVAGLLYALTPSVVTWAQNGRSYALASAAVAATMLAFVHAVAVSTAVTASTAADAGPASTETEPSSNPAGVRRAWVLFGAATVFTGYLHEFTLLLVVAFGITLLWIGVPRAVLKQWLVTTGASVVLVAPLVIFSTTQRGAVSYLQPPNLRSISTLAHELFGSSTVVAAILLVLAMIGAAPAVRQRGSGRVTVANLALPVLVLPAAILMIESVVGRPLYDQRYVLYSTLAAALLAACGVERVGQALRDASGAALRGRAVAVTALVVCAVVAIGQWPEQRFLRTAASRTEDYGAAARYVGRHHLAGDGVVFMNPTARSAKLGFPAQFAGVLDVVSAVPPAQAGTFRGVDKPPARAFAAVRSTDRIWVLGSFPLRRDPKGLAGLAALLRREYTSGQVHRYAGVTVVLYDRKAAYEKI